MDTEAERERVLFELWKAQAEALTTIIRSTPAAELSASFLREVRSFLADSGITHEALNARAMLLGGGGGIPADEETRRRLANLPRFDDDPMEGAT